MYGCVVDPGVCVALLFARDLWIGVVRMCACMTITGVYCVACVCVVASFWFNFTQRGTMHDVVAI